MPANSDMTAVDLHKSAAMWA